MIVEIRALLAMLAIALPATLLLPASALPAPGFDCAKASTDTEHAICADPELAELDAEMTRLYSAARARFEGPRAEQLVDRQRQWLRRRARCGADGACLTRHMRQRIRALSRAVGEGRAVAGKPQTCEESLSAARDVAQRVTFSTSRLEDASPQSSVILSYGRDRNFEAPLPLFAVIDLPPASRFKGTSLLPLAVGAAGPFGIKHAIDRTRLFVPLDAASPPSGETEAYFLSAGTHHLGFSVISAGRCGEQVLRSERGADFTIPLGLPEIVVQDPFSVEQPARTTVAADGRHAIRHFEGRYEVIYRQTGARVLSRSGREARFSPGGRFVASVRPTDAMIEIVDLADGRRIAEFRPGTLAWAHGDSFVIHGGTIRQQVTRMTSTLNPDISDEAQMPNMGVGWRDIEVVLNINQMFSATTSFFVEGFSQGARYRSLITGETRTISNDAIRQEAQKADEGELARQALRQLVSSEKRLTIPLDYPLWRAAGGLIVTHVERGYEGHDQASILQQFKFADDAVVDQEPSEPASGQATSSCGALTLDRGLARADGQVPLCAVAISGRGLAKVPRPAMDTPEETIFERIGGVMGRLRSAGPVRHETFGNYWDDLAERRPKLEALIADFKVGSPAFRVIPLDTADPPTSGECATAPPDFNPLLIEDAWRWTDAGRPITALFVNCHAGSGQFSYASLLLVSPDGSVTDISRALLPDGAPEDDSPFGVTSSDDSALSFFPVGAGRVLVSASYSGFAAIIDTETGQRVGPQLPLVDASIVRAIRLTEDERHVVQLNKDGRFSVLDAETGAIVITGAHIDDEIVAMLPDGRFDTTYEGAQALNLRFAGQTELHTVQQFSAALSRPGLVADVLADRPVAERPATIGLPPVADFAAVPAEEGELSLAVAASDDTGLVHLRIFVEGRLVKTVPVSGRAIEKTVSIANPGGGRWVTVLAVDDDGVLSAPKAVLLPPPAGDRGTIRAVLVGIDSYTGDRRIPPLAYAQSDALRMAAALADRVEGDERVDARVIADEDASADAILAAIRDAASKTRPGDTLLFSFSGHAAGSGETAGTGDLLLLLSGSSTEALRETSLAWKDVAGALSGAKGRVVVLLDACHTGLAGEVGLATNDDAAGALLTAEGAPIVVIAASKGRQLAQESGAWGGGIFTTAIIDALERGNASADADGNGVIDLGEFYTAVKSRVLSETKGQQSPWLVRNRLVGDMGLF